MNVIYRNLGVVDEIVQAKPTIGLAVAMAAKTQRPSIIAMVGKIGQEVLPTPCANKNTVQKQNRCMTLILVRCLAQQFQLIRTIIRL